jgi:hypothetical protein
MVAMACKQKAGGRCSEGLGHRRLIDGEYGVRQGRRRRCVAVFGKLNTVRLNLVALKRKSKI